MSRICFEGQDKFSEFVVGWDPPVQLFYFYGVLSANDEPVVWEKHTSTKSLSDGAGMVGVEIPYLVKMKLQDHQHANSVENAVWDTKASRFW